MEENILELGKEICEAFICGDWRYIPVSNLRHYERSKDVIRRCHICHSNIVLMKEGKDPAHFEHRPGNPDCLLSYDKLDPEKDRASVTITSLSYEQVKESYNFEELIPFTFRASSALGTLADIEDIERTQINRTLRKQLIDARCGQGEFRKSLISYWKACAVSGADKLELLIASHIKPWSVCDNKERLDVYNGFLLSPNIDRAFDHGLISFKDDGTILISKRFESAQAFGICEEQSVKIEERHKPYLLFHRENVFGK